MKEVFMEEGKMYERLFEALYSLKKSGLRNSPCCNK